MKELTLAEIHKELLEMLSHIDDFCRRNSIRYSLGGGTLLGAIRHKGFIPWDDDVDIMMPRPDYDRFLALYNQDNSSPYRCINYVRNDRIRYAKAWAKVHHTGTKCIELKEKADFRYGLNIDVFPIDGLPRDINECRRFLKRCSSIKHRLKMSNIHLTDYDKEISIPKFAISKVVPTKIWKKLSDKLSRRYSYETSEYAGASTGSYGMLERYKKSLFEEYIELPFEDRRFMSIKGYDAYLSQHYADYMQLPPENERVTHNIKVYYI